MARYMLHLKNTNGYRPQDSRRVVYRARGIASEINVPVRVARIATDFVELDVSVDPERLNDLIERLEPIGPIDNIRHVVTENMEKEKGIEEGIFYFNNERFWESHEAFEGVWKQCLGREKELVQGIILLAVAFGHGQRNEGLIGVRMLKRVLEKLGTSPSKYHTIDIDRIRSKAISMRAENQLQLFEI